MRRSVLILAASFLMLVRATGAASAALPVVPTHEIPQPAFEAPKIIGQPIQHPVAVTPVVPPSNFPATETHGSDGTNTGREASWWERLWTDPNISFTAAVAAFTALLAAVSIYQGVQLRRTALAARDSAAALPALERAYVFVRVEWADPDFRMVIANAIDRRLIPDPRGSGQTEDEEAANYRLPPLPVYFRIANHGKTPAILDEISASSTCSIPMPVLTYTGNVQLPPDHVISGNSIFPPEYVDQITIEPEIRFHEARAIQNGANFVWFFGRIKYTDVFDRPHETYFLWRYDGSRFAPYGGHEHNYRT